jgi:hypothetical protein
VGVGVLHMLVNNPHIMIFWIILVINMTREALGLCSLSFEVQGILITALNEKSSNACVHLKNVSRMAVRITFWYAMGVA